jgi:hypothetical protein
MSEVYGYWTPDENENQYKPIDLEKVIQKIENNEIKITFNNEQKKYFDLINDLFNSNKINISEFIQKIDEIKKILSK